MHNDQHSYSFFNKVHKIDFLLNLTCSTLLFFSVFFVRDNTLDCLTRQNLESTPYILVRSYWQFEAPRKSNSNELAQNFQSACLLYRTTMQCPVFPVGTNSNKKNPDYLNKEGNKISSPHHVTPRSRVGPVFPSWLFRQQQGKYDQDLS